MENKMISIREALRRSPRLYRMCDPESEDFQRIVFPEGPFIPSDNDEPFDVLYILTGEDTGAVLIEEEQKDKPCLLPIPDEIFH